MPLKNWKQRSVPRKLTLAELGWMDQSRRDQMRGPPRVCITTEALGSKIQVAETLWRWPQQGPNQLAGMIPTEPDGGVKRSACRI